MKTLLAFLLLSFAGLIIASPTSPYDKYLQDYQYIMQKLNGQGGTASLQSDAKAAGWLANYFARKLGGGQASKQSDVKAADWLTIPGYKMVGKQNTDDLTALLESVLTSEDDEESYNTEDIPAMQSVFNALAQIEEERAKEMDSKSVRAQFLRGLGRQLFNSAKEYLTDRYCPSGEVPTES